MSNANGGTRMQIIDGVTYRADRILPDNAPGSGSIEVHDLESSRLLARVLLDGKTRRMSMETFAGPVRRAVVAWLFAEADAALA